MSRVTGQHSRKVHGVKSTKALRVHSFHSKLFCIQNYGGEKLNKLKREPEVYLYFATLSYTGMRCNSLELRVMIDIRTV
jgi:hypothetical protein